MAGVSNVVVSVGRGREGRRQGRREGRGRGRGEREEREEEGRREKRKGGGREGGRGEEGGEEGRKEGGVSPSLMSHDALYMFLITGLGQQLNIHVTPTTPSLRQPADADYDGILLQPA